MNKRRISFVLCIAMILMLLPMSMLSIDVSAIERPSEQYVSVGTSWTTTTDYAAKAEEGNDNTLYYKDGNNYYPVTWQTDQQLYTISGTTSTEWTPRAVANGTYFYNVDNDKLTFSQVSTKNGDLYYESTVEFKDSTSDDMELHTDWWYWNTSWFVKANDITAPGGYSRLMLVNYGATGRYKAWAYYWRDGRYNSTAGQMSHKWTASRGTLEYNRPNNAYYNSNYCTEVTIDGSIGYIYTWVASDKHFGLQTYLRTTGANSIWYNNGRTQLGNTVYDTDAAATNSNQKAYVGALYTKNNTGTTTLTNKDTGAVISGVSPSAINGDVIYSGDLYVKKYEALPQPTPTTIITTDETGDDGVYTSKELTANGDAYDVTLTAYTTGNEVKTSSETITPTVKPMDIVMVIDQSGSMATRDMGNTYTPATTPSGGWTMETATGGKQYYYSPDGSNYYPVYASTGYIYEKVENAPRASDMLSNGDDAISLGVNGAPTYYNIKTDYYVMDNGDLHQLYLITAGLFLQYGLYPYIYKDNNDAFTTKAKWEGNNYWVAVFDPWDGSDLRDNGTWNMLAGNSGNGTSARFSFINTDGQAIGGSDANADSARLSYSWVSGSARIANLYQKTSTKVANQLYYVDAAGNRQNIGEAAQFSGDVVYTGTLYEGASESRVDALKASVTQFANTVQQNAKQYGVDHRMALVGFAGNKVPAYSLGSDAVTVGSNGLKDYTNTGLFYNGGFENYEKITGFESTSEQYINRHYYKNVNGTDGTPVKYSDGWKTLNLTTGATASTTAGNWYKATYEGNGTSLSAADYRAALVSVNNNDALNSNISTAISQFAANGGTYTSYGMSMAEQLYKAVEDAGDTEGVDSEGQTVERQRVIIVFTDGEPGANGYNSSIAGEALVSGNLAKTEQDAIVYTVGLFKSAPSSQVADFMKKLSSEYEMTLSKVYGGADNSNYSLGDLDPSKTYYYKNESTGKYYAVTTEYGSGNSLGWWIYNGSKQGNTTSYSLTNPKRSTGAGTTVFYNAKGSSVNGEDVKTGTTYYTSDGDKIVYEYRWFDSDRSIKNPALSSGQSTSAGESRVQFYDLAGTIANDDGLSYYMTASNAAELNNVFAQIAGSIVSEEVTVENGSAYTEDTMYVMDEISSDFDLPSDLTAANNHVTVYADTVSEWNDDGSPKTYNESTTPLRQGDEHAIEAGNADVEVVWQGKKLQVNYFDFGRMYMQQSNPNAARIRVVIDGITPNKAGEKLYSNTAQSGLYYKDPESGAVTMVEPFNRPYISVPGYTVKWVDDQGTNMDTPYDQDTDLIKGDVPIYDGDEPMKEADHVYTYQFDGWSTTKGGAKVIDITRDAESGVVTSYGTFPGVVDSDVTYYAHFNPTEIVRYTVTWKMNDGTNLKTDNDVDAGTIPEYNGKLPAINASDNYTYFFVGWSDHQTSVFENAVDAQAAVISIEPVSGNVDYYAVFGRKEIQTENYVYDFSTVTTLDTVPEGVTIETLVGASGAFDVRDRKLIFVPNNLHKDKTFDLTPMSNVNTAIYQDANGDYKKVTVVAASSVYYDDDLLNKSSEATNGYGYSSSITGAGTSDNAKDISTADAAVMYEFTFTGTGIDLYCTTDSETGYVQASLYDADGTRLKTTTIKNKSMDEGNYYNVPTVSFTDYPYGAYTLKLNVLKNAKYKFDGVRVYGAVKSDDYAKGEAEASAQYFNLRENLLNPENTTYTAISKTSVSDASVVSGVLFLDNAAKISYTTVNDKGETKTVYESDFAAYKANSPKNEIYLTNGQGVAFKLANWNDIKADAKVYIGMSAPKNGAGIVSVNNTDLNPPVNSFVDMYYPVIPDANGVIKIVNNGTALISLTNLKITGANLDRITAQDIEKAEQQGTQSLKAAKRMAFAMMTTETVENIAEIVEPEITDEPDVPTEPEEPVIEEPEEPINTPSAEVTPSPSPTTKPSTGNSIVKALSTLVSNLIKSISKWFR